MAAFTGSPVSAHAIAHAVLPVSELGGDIYFAQPFNYVHGAGTGTGQVNLCRLPAGSWTVVAALSVIAVAQLSASATIALGVRITSGGAEDGAAFFAATDAASAAISMSTFAALGGSDVPIVNTSPTTIFATIASGNITNTKTIDGVLVFKRT